MSHIRMSIFLFHKIMNRENYQCIKLPLRFQYSTYNIQYNNNYVYIITVYVFETLNFQCTRRKQHVFARTFLPRRSFLSR